MTDVHQTHRDQLLEKLKKHFVADVARQHRLDKDVLQSFLLNDVLVATGENEGATDVMFSHHDMQRFVALPRFELGSAVQKKIKDAIISILLSISEYLRGNDSEADGNLSQEEEAMNLPLKIHSLENLIRAKEMERADVHKSISTLLTETLLAHRDLDDQLTNAISTIGLSTIARRSAHANLLATTLETCLIKLSLLRIRAHSFLYANEQSSEDPLDASGSHFPQALEQAMNSLKLQELRMKEGERALDRELNAYDELLRLVDGDGNGYKQIVEDWTRVKRETEECKRDLRRLGWTGD